MSNRNQFLNKFNRKNAIDLALIDNSILGNLEFMICQIFCISEKVFVEICEFIFVPTSDA